MKIVEIKQKIVEDRFIMNRETVEEIANIVIDNNVEGIANVTYVLHDTSIIFFFEGKYFKCRNPFINDVGVIDLRIGYPDMVGVHVPYCETLSHSLTIEHILNLLNNNIYPPERVINISNLTFDLTPLEMAGLKKKYYSEYQNTPKSDIPIFVKLLNNKN